MVSYLTTLVGSSYLETTMPAPDHRPASGVHQEADHEVVLGRSIFAAAVVEGSSTCAQCAEAVAVAAAAAAWLVVVDGRLAQWRRGVRRQVDVGAERGESHAAPVAPPVHLAALFYTGFLPLRFAINYYYRRHNDGLALFSRRPPPPPPPPSKTAILPIESTLHTHNNTHILFPLD